MTPCGNTARSKLDELWQSIGEYRKCQHFRDVLNACRQFRELAPYNAMLVQMQRPGAQYVMTQDRWEKKYQRVIKPNARPLIILVPFGPVEFVFEIGDTKPSPGSLFTKTDVDILDEIAEPYRTKKNVPKQTLDTLIENLVFNGIIIDPNFVAGSSFAAQIEQRNDLEHIYIPINKEQCLKRKADYLLSVNNNAAAGEVFASICHELAHLYLHHIKAPYDWKKWETRQLMHEHEEFEAEAVSWLVCERMGVVNPSERYLANFFSSITENSVMPREISIERILSATRDIEAMCEPMNYRCGLLYKHCETFKHGIKL